MSINYRLLLLFSTFLAACRSAPSVRTPEPSVGDPVTRSIDLNPEVTSWTITPTNEEHRYTSVTNALLELMSPSGASRDTITSTVNYSLAITRNIPPASYSARIESIAIKGGSRTAAPTFSSSLPFVFGGRLELNRITLDLPKLQTEASITCSSEVLSSIPIVQRSLILIPLQLRAGMTWTDSTLTSVCSGPLLVSLTSIRTYHVKGQTSIRGHNAVLLDQESRTRFAGEGVQDQHRIQVRGDGSGRAQLAVDAQSGALIEAAGDHTTSITVTSSGRDQRFTQITRERVSRLE